jgi:hypothetical protein
VLTVLEYYALGRPQLVGLSGDALINAQRSLIANAPTVSTQDRTNLLAVVTDTLPYFVIDPETGAPKLVIPPAATPPAPVPTPPGSVPPGSAPPGTTTTTTPPATETPVQNVAPQPTQPIYVPAGTTCPQGYVASPQPTSAGVPTPTIEEQVQSAFSQLPPTVTAFGCKCNPVIAAPWPITQDDALVINLWNIAACPTTVTAVVKTMDCNCNIQTSSQSVSMAAYVRTGPSSFGAPLTATIKIPLSDGFLLSVALSMTATFVIEAHMYAVAQLVGSTGTGLASATLFQDYLQFGKSLGWPGGRQLSVGEGPGTARWRNFSYHGGDGETDTWQVHGGSIALCRQVYFVLNTSAAAGNRQLYLVYTAPEMPGPLTFSNGLAQPPSTSWGWIFAPGIQAGLFNTFWSQTPIPDNLWQSGAGGISLVIIGDDAGDSMSMGGVAFQMWAGPPVAF